MRRTGSGLAAHGLRVLATMLLLATVIGTSAAGAGLDVPPSAALGGFESPH